MRFVCSSSISCPQLFGNGVGTSARRRMSCGTCAMKSCSSAASRTSLRCSAKSHRSADRIPVYRIDAAFFGEEITFKAICSMACLVRSGWTVRGPVRGLPRLSGVRSGVSIVEFQGVPGCRGVLSNSIQGAEGAGSRSADRVPQYGGPATLWAERGEWYDGGEFCPALPLMAA